MQHTWDDYQRESRKTALYPPILGKNFVYPALGLAGETGEVVEKVKKIMRDKEGVLTEEDRERIAQELGDVLWYLTQLATELDLRLEDIARKNLEKLLSRKKRGVLHGEGDTR